MQIKLCKRHTLLIQRKAISMILKVNSMQDIDNNFFFNTTICFNNLEICTKQVTLTSNHVKLSRNYKYLKNA